MIYEEIRQLVAEEQERQAGRFIGSLSLDDYLDKLDRLAEFLIHYSEGRLAGLVAFYCNDMASRTAFITLVLTAPSARGKKIASALLDGVLANTRERGFLRCSLEVRKDNQAALALYLKKGFSITGETDNSYLMAVEQQKAGPE